MNIVNISYMSKAEIESAFHGFDKDQLAAAVERLIQLVDKESESVSLSTNMCCCCCCD